MSEATPATRKRPEVPARIWPADNAQYLLDNNWRPTGHPQDPGTRWIDPTRPEKDIEQKVKVGEVTHENGHVEVIEQIHITPRAQPVSMHEAVHMQMVRDGKIQPR